MAEVRAAANKFVTFLNRAVTPYHAVAECAELLRSAGFKYLREEEPWTSVVPGGRYYTTKNCTSIIAFAVGEQYKAGSGGFSIVVGHTDSPCLRVKPHSRQTAEKFNQVGCSTYGGGLWRTWMDRDLSVAGMCVVKEKDGALKRHLVRVDRPVLFIPNLAIHLCKDRNVFEVNTEKQLRPLLETHVRTALADGPAAAAAEPKPAANAQDIRPYHHENFIKLIAEEAKVNPEELVDFDLYLFDTQPAAITGLHDEFISGARLDNLVGTFTSISALIESAADLKGERNIRLAACFDNEEVGSGSMMGAESAWTQWVLRRLAIDDTNPVAFEQTIARSMLISADQAHAAHPNYGEQHEENHRPRFHGGVVLKINQNQRYATTSTTSAVLKTCATEANVPLQEFVVRNDMACGSTVGPILASKLGLQTVDVGCPQLAMHSIREFGDSSSIWQAITLYRTFFNRLPQILDGLYVNDV